MKRIFLIGLCPLISSFAMAGKPVVLQPGEMLPAGAVIANPYQNQSYSQNSNMSEQFSLAAGYAAEAPYDVIFVGSPCWWGTVAPPVATFLAAYDWSGKTVAPFMTHGGSRMGRSEDDIEKLCPGATLLGGLPVRGSAVKGSLDAVGKWIGGMNLSK